MALDETDLDALVSEAAVILDEAAKPFVAGHRADSAVQKKGNDFATEVDLAIERQVVDALVSSTGIEVHGEEFGGADVDSPLVWVLDPIDGTFNYAAGLADGGDPAGPAARRRAGGGADLAAVHRPALHRRRREAAVRQRCCPAAAGAGQAGRLSGRHRHLQHRLPRTFPRPLSGGHAGAPEPRVLADADARCHRHRPGLHRRRNPRWGNQFRPSSSGITRPASRWCGPPAASSPTWQATTGRPSRSRRWPDCPACTASSSTSCGRPVIRRTTDEPRRPRGSRHPVPGRRRRPGGQGRQLRKPARRRRSRRTRRRLRRARAPTS